MSFLTENISLSILTRTLVGNEVLCYPSFSFKLFEQEPISFYHENELSENCLTRSRTSVRQKVHTLPPFMDGLNWSTPKTCPLTEGLITANINVSLEADDVVSIFTLLDVNQSTNANLCDLFIETRAGAVLDIDSTIHQEHNWCHYQQLRLNVNDSGRSSSSFRKGRAALR